MAFNDEIANRIRVALKLLPETFEEKRMFGGLCFLLKGKMTVGIISDDIIVRIPGHKMESVLNNIYTRPMDFTGKPMKEFVYVEPEGFKEEEQLLNWIELGVEHAKSKF